MTHIMDVVLDIRNKDKQYQKKKITKLHEDLILVFLFWEGGGSVLTQLNVLTKLCFSFVANSDFRNK